MNSEFIQESKDFDEWFDSLSLEEQQEYIAELEADRYIDEAKSEMFNEEC